MLVRAFAISSTQIEAKSLHFAAQSLCTCSQRVKRQLAPLSGVSVREVTQIAAPQQLSESLSGGTYEGRRPTEKRVAYFYFD